MNFEDGGHEWMMTFLRAKHWLASHFISDDWVNIKSLKIANGQARESRLDREYIALAESKKCKTMNIFARIKIEKFVETDPKHKNSIVNVVDCKRHIGSLEFD